MKGSCGPSMPKRWGHLGKHRGPNFKCFSTSNFTITVSLILLSSELKLKRLNFKRKHLNLFTIFSTPIVSVYSTLSMLEQRRFFLKLTSETGPTLMQQCPSSHFIVFFVHNTGIPMPFLGFRHTAQVITSIVCPQQCISLNSQDD